MRQPNKPTIVWSCGHRFCAHDIGKKRQNTAVGDMNCLAFDSVGRFFWAVLGDMNFGGQSPLPTLPNYLGRAHVSRVALAVKHNKPLDPVDILPLGG